MISFSGRKSPSLVHALLALVSSPLGISIIVCVTRQLCAQSMVLPVMGFLYRLVTTLLSSTLSTKVISKKIYLCVIPHARKAQIMLIGVDIIQEPLYGAKLQSQTTKRSSM